MSKSCIYKNASKLSKVDKAALLESYDSFKESGQSEEQAFVSSMAQMTQATLDSRNLLKKELELDYGIKVPSRTASYINEAQSYIDKEITTGNLATDLVSKALGMLYAGDKFIRNTLGTYLKPKNNQKIVNILSTNFNFFSRYVAGTKFVNLPKLNSEQNDAIKALAVYVEEFNNKAIELNNFLEGNLFVNNIEGYTRTEAQEEQASKEGNKTKIPVTTAGDLLAYFVQQDSEGNRYLSENYNAAMATVLLNWIGTSGKDSIFTDRDGVKATLGLSSTDTLDTAIIGYMSDKGDVRSALADRLGSEILAVLGLVEQTDKTGNSVVDGDAINKIKTGLGLTAIGIIMDMGLVEETTIPSAILADFAGNTDSPFGEINANTPFIRVASEIDHEGVRVPNKAAQAVIDIIKESDKVIPTLFNIQGSVREVSFTKIDSVPAQVKNSGQNVAKKQQKAVKKLQDIEQVLFEENLEFYDIVGEDAWKDIEGFVDDIEALHITKRTGAQGKNASIKTELSKIQDFRDKMPNISSVFYYPWEVWKNLRMGLSSSDFNPQNNKIQRWLAGAKSWKTTLEPGNVAQLNLLKISIAASFGVNFDKQPLEKTIAEFDALKNNEVINNALAAMDQLQENPNMDIDTKLAFREDIVEGIKEGGEKMHSLAGLIALKNLYANYGLNSDTGKIEILTPFETTLGLETDGLTNGVVITLLQSMNDPNITMLLESGGMFADGKTLFFGDWYDGVRNIDSYQRLSLSWNKYIKQMGYPASVEVLLSELFKLMVNADGTLTAFGRKMAKDPLMTSNYGAGITAIKKTISTFATENWYDKVMSAKDDGELQRLINNTMEANDVILQNRIAAAIAEKKPKLAYYLKTQVSSKKGKINRPIYKNRKDWRLPQNIEALLANTINDTIGSALEYALDEQFIGVKKYAFVVNNSMAIQYEAFMLAYTREKDIQETSKAARLGVSKDKASLNKEELAELYKMFQHMMPGMNTDFSSKKEDRLVIMKTEKVQNTEKGTQVKFSRKLNNNAAHDKQTVTGVLAGPFEINNSNSGSMRANTYSTQPKKPGVSGLARSTQSVDATNMVGNFEYDVMNVHDAIILGISKIEEATRANNKDFIGLNTRYSVIEETAAQTTRVLQGLREYSAELYAQFTGILAENSDITMFNRFDEPNPDNWVEEVFDELAAFSKEIADGRKEGLGKLISGQFVLPNAGYNPDTEITAEATEQQLKDAVDAVADDFLKSAGVAFDYEAFVANYVQLSAKNTEQIFEQIQNLFPADKQDSPEQVKHLRSVINTLVNKVLNEADRTPVLLGINTTGTEILGQTAGNIIQIQAGTSGSVDNTSQLSTQETFVHELVHQVVRYALDTNFTLRNQIEKLRNQVKANIKVEDFMPAQVAVSIAEDYKAAQARYAYIFKGKNSLQEFVAFGTTNEVFRAKLAKISATPTRDASTDSLLDRVKALYAKIMDYIEGKFFGTSNLNADKALDLMVNNLVDTNARYQAGIENSQSFVDKANKLTIAQLDKRIFTPVSNYYKKEWAGKETKNIVSRTFKIALSAPFIFKDKIAKGAFQNAVIRVIRSINLTESNFMIKLAREIQGMTKDGAPFHNLLRKSKHLVDQERRHIAEIISKQSLKEFKTDITNEDSDAITQAIMNTGMGVLMGKYTLGQVIGFMKDPNSIAPELARITKGLESYTGNGNYYARQASSLGTYLATGGVTEASTKLNAYNIANLLDTKGTAVGNVAEAEVLIDVMATLVALRETAPEITGRAARVLKREFKANPDRNGITFLLETLDGFQEESLKTLFNGNKTQMVKGYTSEIYNPNIDMKIAPVSSAKELRKDGYKPVGAPLIIDKAYKSEPMQVYINKFAAQSTYNKATVSLTSLKAKGTDLNDILKSTGKRSTKLDRLAAMSGVSDYNRKLVEDQFNNPTPNIKQDNENFLIPVFNEAGEVTTYRYAISEANKVQFLDKKYQFNIVLGRMAGSIVDKVNSEQINNEVVATAYEDFNKNYGDSASDWITIGKNVTDPKYKELYNLMPYAMQKEIRDTWGKDEMVVREEYLDLIMGFRKLSFTNLPLFWFKNKDGSRKRVFDEMESVWPDAKLTVKIIEQAWQELVVIAKENIVIKSGVVLYDNVFSNNIILAVKGVNPKHILKDTALAYSALDNYQEEVNKKLVLEHRLSTARDLTKPAIARIEKQLAEYAYNIKQNPVHELLSQGVFQSIVEDVDLHNNDYSFRSKAADLFTTKLKSLSKDSKVKQATTAGATEIYKQVYITKDTASYQTLLQLTQKSDFVARFALYQHHMRKIDRVNASNKPYNEAQLKKAKQKALLDVIDTFINYDIPTSPEMQYLNDMGVMMFTKFLFRIQRIILRMFRDNPASSLAFLSTERMIGEMSSIDDSFLPFSSIWSKGNPFDIVDPATDIPMQELLSNIF